MSGRHYGMGSLEMHFLFNRVALGSDRERSPAGPTVTCEGRSGTRFETNSLRCNTPTLDYPTTLPPGIA